MKSSCSWTQTELPIWKWSKSFTPYTVGIIVKGQQSCDSMDSKIGFSLSSARDPVISVSNTASGMSEDKHWLTTGRRFDSRTSLTKPIGQWTTPTPNCRQSRNGTDCGPYAVSTRWSFPGTWLCSEDKRCYTEAVSLPICRLKEEESRRLKDKSDNISTKFYKRIPI